MRYTLGYAVVWAVAFMMGRYWPEGWLWVLPAILVAVLAGMVAATLDRRAA